MWEVVKENVAPLRRGRDTTKIAKAFTPAGAAAAGSSSLTSSSLLLKKEAFEEAIAKEEATVALFAQYASWLDETWPTDRSAGFLVREACARKFRDDERYKKDERYVGVWLEYVDGVEDRLEAFKFMEVKGIGVEVATFWERWAAAAEDRKRPRFALDVLEKGLIVVANHDNFAAASCLRKKRDNLLARVDRMPPDEIQEEEPRRRPLANVRNARRAVGRRPTSGVPLPSSAGPAFAVFVDDDLREDDGPDDDQDDWPDFGTAASRSKENNLPPAKWTDSKIGKRKLLDGVKLPSRDVPAIFQDLQEEGTHPPEEED